MYQIGVDAGSTYTKYCIVSHEKGIVKAWREPTPVRQRDFFAEKVKGLRREYADARIVSCGYGKDNVPAVKRISELSALARGCAYMGHANGTVMDIGGQDTKVAVCQNGKLKEFFVNEKCAAGCGMFLTNTLRLLEMDFETINLWQAKRPKVSLSSVCAVFAQTEIVELLAQDYLPEEILKAVVWHILSQAKGVLAKVDCPKVILSGGLAQIPGITRYAEMVWGRQAELLAYAPFLPAIGCAAILCGTGDTADVKKCLTYQEING